jgi:hypothetical protein
MISKNNGAPCLILQNTACGKYESVLQCVCIASRLGGVVVSVLAIGPNGCMFKTGGGDGFLRAIKIRSTLSSG